MNTTNQNTNNQLLLSITKVNAAAIQGLIILEDKDERRKLILVQCGDWNSFVEQNSDRPIL